MVASLWRSIRNRPIESEGLKQDSLIMGDCDLYTV